eukprot:Ihof_evm21s24 gene=Ihof_evmTU21s24
MTDGNMENALKGLLGEGLFGSVQQARVLVVGMGGIGCELLKNLVLSGFKHIEVIDLDTIDVSNLNRQFLFQRVHVGQSKAKVAVQAVGRMNPAVNLVAHHSDVKSEEFGPDFVAGFTIVLNALDNLSARNHVNRLCLAANVPLVESGTAGYLGQVSVILKGHTECFECQPKPAPKKHPVCTIRNTPSQPIHCIVWAKYLFQQLFDHAEDDNAISPNVDDPEAIGNGNDKQPGDETTALRRWATSVEYDGPQIFDRVFRADVETLLSMTKLWEKRRSPTPLHLADLPDETPHMDTKPALPSQRMWSMRECGDMFIKSIKKLRVAQLCSPEGELGWDKDDEDALNFVIAASNLRSHVFGIPTKCPFDIKSMAGNIIPAIPTTNAVIAGLIVQEAMKILAGQWKRCQTTYLWRVPNSRKKLLVPNALEQPNPKCYVCAPKPEVTIYANLDKMTLQVLQQQVLQGKLNMVAPDVMCGASILLSSDEDEIVPGHLLKTLSQLGLARVTTLQVDDFLQKFTLTVHLRHKNLTEVTDFEVVGTAEPEPEPSKEANPAEDDGETLMIVETAI